MNELTNNQNMSASAIAKRSDRLNATDAISGLGIVTLKESAESLNFPLDRMTRFCYSPRHDD